MAADLQSISLPATKQEKCVWESKWVTEADQWVTNAYGKGTTKAPKSKKKRGVLQ